MGGREGGCRGHNSRQVVAACWVGVLVAAAAANLEGGVGGQGGLQVTAAAAAHREGGCEGQDSWQVMAACSVGELEERIVGHSGWYVLAAAATHLGGGVWRLASTWRDKRLVVACWRDREGGLGQGGWRVGCGVSGTEAA